MPNKPIYCIDCRASREFERFPERDIDNGAALLEWCWRCPVCGHITWTLSLTEDKEVLNA